MLVGVISDSHDNLKNVNKLIKIFKEKNIDCIIHCGDFCAPFILKALDKFEKPVHLVFGNTNDLFNSTKICENSNNLKLYGNTASFEIDGKKVCVNHYPDIARAFAMTKDYDIVFYGHSHIKNKEKINNCLLVNPGELGNIKNNPTYVIWNTENNDIEFNDL